MVQCYHVHFICCRDACGFVSCNERLLLGINAVFVFALVPETHSLATTEVIVSGLSKDGIFSADCYSALEICITDGWYVREMCIYKFTSSTCPRITVL